MPTSSPRLAGRIRAHRNSLLAASALLALVPSAALAQDAPPIIDGDETAAFGAVGVLVALDRSGRGGNYCSGTLVDSNWVITAAHCVEGSEYYTDEGFDLYFMVGTDIYSRSGITEYAQIIDQTPHPGYDARYLEHDIAVLELGGTGIRGEDPMPMRDYSIGRDERGDDVTFVGWGINSDRGSGSGYKRTVDVPIYDVYSNGTLITHDSDGNRNICSGDSGGATLMVNSAGLYELAAVNSFGFMLDGSSRVLCDDPDAAAGSWRVDVDYDWIVGVIGYEPDVDATEAPEGGTGGSGDGDGGSGDDGSGDDGSGDGDDGSTDSVDGEDEANEVDSFGDTTAEDGDVKAGCATAGDSVSGAAGLGLVALAMLGLARRRDD